MTVPFVGFAVALGATGVMRLVELAVSVRRSRARPDAVVAEGALFPAMAALHAGLVVAPLVEVVALDRPFVPWLFAVAVAVLAVATALRIWTLATLGRVWNVRVVPPPPDAVVTTGPYRYIRHPNYLCVILEIAALPLLHDAWLSAIGLTLWNAAVLAVRIPTEERALSALPAWRAAFQD
ncbi:MAG: isoprenylcysteine carboxylmethyltransferase family protein, partial [Myxococcota bacterium]